EREGAGGAGRDGAELEAAGSGAEVEPGDGRDLGHAGLEVATGIRAGVQGVGGGAGVLAVAHREADRHRLVVAGVGVTRIDVRRGASVAEVPREGQLVALGVEALRPVEVDREPGNDDLRAGIQNRRRRLIGTILGMEPDAHDLALSAPLRSRVFPLDLQAQAIRASSPRPEILAWQLGAQTDLVAAVVRRRAEERG